METAEISLDELVAHRPPMRFIHRVLSISDGEAVVEATVGPDNPLWIPGRGLPAYAGVEMMAQAIAAIDGMKRKLEGLPPKIGFLLGCRGFLLGCRGFLLRCLELLLHRVGFLLYVPVSRLPGGRFQLFDGILTSPLVCERQPWKQQRV